MKKPIGHSIKVQLRRQPGPGNAVFIDGKKLGGVTKITIIGRARAMPLVKITLLPTVLSAKIDDLKPVFYRPPKKV